MGLQGAAALIGAGGGQLHFGPAAVTVLRSGFDVDSGQKVEAMRTIVLVAALVVLWATASPVWAQSVSADEQPASERDYGIYYGDGVRHLAEGRYDEAVDDLFRAYGLGPSAHVMELIIDSYDSMGHCDAARRQIGFFDARHGDEGEPQLDRCAQTGQLVIDCDAVGRRVQINRHRRARCGEVVEVPAGEDHRIAWSGARFGKPVSVAAGERRHVKASPDDDEFTADDISVSRLPGLVGQVARLPGHRRSTPDVPRLPSLGESSYRVYETSDGIYQVWSVHPRSERSPGQTDVEIVCPEDAPNGEEEAECVLLREHLDEAR